MKLTKITINPGGDGYFILFVDGVKFDEGDNYDEHMSHKIRGIVDFLEFKKIDHSFNQIKLKTKDKDDSFLDHDYQPDEDENLEDYLKRMKKNFKVVNNA